MAKDKTLLILGGAVVVGLAVWAFSRRPMEVNAQTQEFKNVPKSVVDKDAYKPPPAEVMLYKTNPDAWAEDKLKEIEAGGTHIPSPDQEEQRAIVKEAIILENQARLAPETINWIAVADARQEAAVQATDPVIINNYEYAAQVLQQAVAQGASPAVLAVVAQTNRTDVVAIQTQIDTGIPPKPPQSVVNAMIAAGQALPSWYIEYYA